eukprot:11547316-Alexandrium_andersonii.AAC.1
MCATRPHARTCSNAPMRAHLCRDLVHRGQRKTQMKEEDWQGNLRTCMQTFGIRLASSATAHGLPEGQHPFT